MKDQIYDINFINGFVVQFKTHKDTECHYDEDKLLGVKYEGKRVIWTGDTIFCKGKGWYQLNSMKKVSSNGRYDLYTALIMERSDTAMMILPFNGGTGEEIQWSRHLINAFSFREGFDDNDRIWVLFRRPLTGSVEYENIMSIMRSNEDCIGEEFIGSEYQMFTMLIPEEFKEDADLILQSKFSQISESAKRRIFRFHNIQDDHNKIKLQLNRNPILKKKLENDLGVKISANAELRSAIDVDRETFFNSYIIDDSRIMNIKQEV